MSCDEGRGAAVAGAAPAPRPARDSLLTFADSMLARPAASAPATEAALQSFVTFFLGPEEFGVPVLHSREIVRVGEITRIPEAPPHVRGVLNLRGRMVPVVEIRTRLGLALAPATPHSRVIVVEAHDRLFGLLVDRVSRIAKIPTSTIRPAPAEAMSANTDYVTGIAQTGDKLIILLDIDKVLLLNPTASEPADATAEPRS